MLSNPEDMLSILLGGALGRSGRKRARRAASFLSGRGGFLTASSLMAAAGVLWGIYDSVKAGNTGAIPPLPSTPPVAPGAPAPAGVLTGAESLPADILRIVRLAVSAARADGTLSPQERGIIRERAKAAGLESIVDVELGVTRALADIVGGVTDPAAKRDLYILVFTIVRADESVTGAERVYLAQLAYQLGLDTETVGRLETETAAKIDAQE
ncbi:MAG: DUF533 domain-containing protein [Vicinamibacterales bacterium]